MIWRIYVDKSFGSKKAVKMSNEDAENVLKNKLLEILYQELSSLNLLGEKKEHEFPNDNPAEQRKNDITVEKEASSASSDNTAGILTKGNNVENEQLENEALDPPDQNVEDAVQTLLTSNNCPKIGRILMEEPYEPVSEKKTTKYLQQSNGNDKICHDSMETFIPPPDNLAEKILRRVELYFEDYNIFKNSFLLNHVRRSKKGFISLKLIASLRKIKTLTKDFRVVAYSIRKSKVLEFNNEGSKIRRIEPVPKIEDTKYGKTLMIFNLPLQNSTVDYLIELFSKFGNIIAVGIFGNNQKDCDAYHERCLHFHRRIASRVYGIVEFELYDQVVNALKDDEGHLPKENEMKVVPLMPQIYRKEKRHLKFLESYHQYPRREYGRYYPREDSRTYQNEVPAPNDDIRGRKMNMGGYQYNRGNYRRSYKRRKNYAVPNTKNFWEDQVVNNFNGAINEKWGESRQLKANNSYNIDHYQNMPRKRAGNGCIDNGIPV